jgi:hypothetical protein
LQVDRVRERLANGDSFADAVTGAKREYIRTQSETFLEGSFADWH